MTAQAATRPRRRRGLFAESQRIRFIRFPLALALAELGVLFVISAVVDLAHDADVTVAFAIAGVALGAVGIAELRRVPRPSVASAPAVLTMATLTFVFLGSGGALAHLLTDGVDHGLAAAIFEGTAAVTTTALTGVDPETVPEGLLIFRAMLQWLGGLAALGVALVVIPMVFGGQELRGRGQTTRAGTALISGHTRGSEKILALYAGFTALLVAAYLVAGMGLFDAIAHALTTSSTGGLSTRTDSIGAFDSAAIEWVAAGGMAVAGLSLGVLWWVVQRDHRALARSSELRAYAIGLVVSVTVIAGSLGSGGFRTAVVSVTSAMSTTGFTTDQWWMFGSGAQTVLIVLIGIGSMAGSAGGGFRYLRVLEAFRFATRELRRQLHPAVVAVVRVNGGAASERTLDRMTGFIIVFILVVATGGMAIELGDSTVSPAAAITLSVSALSTAGPQVIDPVDVASLGAISKLSLAGLMLLGRLSIYAALITVINAIARFRVGASRRVEHALLHHQGRRER